MGLKKCCKGCCLSSYRQHIPAAEQDQKLKRTVQLLMELSCRDVPATYDLKEANTQVLPKRMKALQPERMCCMLYTSGDAM